MLCSLRKLTEAHFSWGVRCFFWISLHTIGEDCGGDPPKGKFTLFAWGCQFWSSLFLFIYFKEQSDGNVE